MLENCKKSCNLLEESRNFDGFQYKPRPYFETAYSPKCQLYMAESSIPNSGLGMYTASTITKGQYIYHPDIVVNYFDFEANTDIAAYLKELEETNKSEEWEAAIRDKKNKYGRSCDKWAKEGECENNAVYMKNFCARSCAAYEAGFFDRIESKNEKSPWLPNDYYWDPSNTESSFEADEVSSLVPGLGALANSHTGLVNCKIGRGTSDIVGLHRSQDPSAGAFSSIHNMNYVANQNIQAGMELFVAYGDNWFSEREWKFGPLPLSYHFEEADAIIESFWKHVNGEDSFAEDLYTLTKDLVVDKKTAMALPDTFEMAKVAATEGTAILTVPNAVRSPEWLEENGTCLDNIRAEPSTIREAGRGAFATRNLNEGDIIAPLPLLHLDSERLRMWDELDGDHEELNKQLLVNYSYGHRDSSLLLFPYSPVVNFVNNNVDKNKINAEIRWSTSGYHAKDWEELTYDEVVRKKQAGLILEFVALRDIKRGEEIFIDYGADWDHAWEEHVSSWKPPEDSSYIPPHQMNIETEIRTMTEQQNNPYARNIMTICYTTIAAEDVEDEDPELEYDWEDFPAEPTAMKNCWPCDVLERYTGYDIETGKDVDAYKVKFKLEENVSVTMFDLPRKSIEFVSREYQSDQHLKHGFRHPIHIPDSIFPKKWKNLIIEDKE